MMRYRQNRRRFVIGLFTGVIIAIYVILRRSMIQVHVKYDEGNFGNFEKGQKHYTDQIRNEQTCVHPNLELWHPKLKSLFTKPKPLECSLFDKNWVSVKNGSVYISEEATRKHGDITCAYSAVLRGNSDDDVIAGENIMPMPNGMKMTSDFFKVKCLAKDGAKYMHIHSGIANLKELHERKPVKSANNSLNLDIIMFGMDSTSRMTWMRNLPKTHDYVVNKLGGVVMEGYNIVGDGTPQALLPILTGKTEVELPEARKNFAGAKPVDGHPWIWKELVDLGYVTQWGEDMQSVGTFNYRMLGFTNPPVDHYMRPFYLAAEKVYQLNKPLCLGSMPRHLNMLNWIRNFVDMYPKKLKFSFVFHSEYSHGGFSESQLADDDVEEFVRYLQENGHLDRAVLIMMADHGARFQMVRQTEQGKYEERMPYMVIRIPPSLSNRYPEILENLKTNAHRLTTPFDLHATFEDIINYDTQTKIGDIHQRGISLFKEIPIKRSCADAHVESHWCACLNWEKVSVSDPQVKITADHLVATINSYTSEHHDKCQTLKLDTIDSAVRLSANKNVLHFKKSKDTHGRVPDLSDNMNEQQILYQLAITTTPGGGKYEATLTYDVETATFVLNAGEISRINKYGRQPACIMAQHPHLRPYCYCRIQSR